MDIRAAAAAYNSIAGIAQAPSSVAPSDKTNSADPSFAELISQSLGAAVDKGYKAEKVSTLALMGKSDLTDVVTAVGAAEQALQTVVAVRDKIISAYQQIMQMPL